MVNQTFKTIAQTHAADGRIAAFDLGRVQGSQFGGYCASGLSRGGIFFFAFAFELSSAEDKTFHFSCIGPY